MSGRNDHTAELIAHAKKNGPECVMETARDFWELGQMSTNDVIQLQRALDSLPASKRRGFSERKVNHRLTAEERVERLLGLSPTQEEEDA